MITRKKNNIVPLVKTVVRGGVESYSLDNYNYDYFKDGSWTAKQVILIDESDLSEGSMAWATDESITFDLSPYLEGSLINKYECLFRCKVITGNNLYDRAALVIDSDLGIQAITGTCTNQVQNSTILSGRDQFGEDFILLPVSKEVTVRNAIDFDTGVRHFKLLAFRPLAQ